MRKLNGKLLKENIEKRIKKDMSDANVGGAAILVCQNSKFVYRNFFGTINPEGSGEKISLKTLFRLASMTKPVTTAAVLILCDRNLLSLKTPVEEILPEFKNMYLAEPTEDRVFTCTKKAENKLIVAHLLNHTSGLGNGPCGEFFSKNMTADDKSTLDKSIRYYSKMGYTYEPGTHPEYNPVISFDIAAKIVEVLTNKNYEDFLKEEIFAPCEMNDTMFVPKNEEWKRIIGMHKKLDKKSYIDKTVEGCVFEDYPAQHCLGGAGLVSSADDYMKFANMLLNGGVANGRRILSEQAVKAMSIPQNEGGIQPEHQRWGLGVRVVVDEAYKILPVGTYGWSGAYGTHFWIDPENKVTAVYMKNSRYDGGGEAKTSYNFEEDVFCSFE